jgi:hypothetical protein
VNVGLNKNSICSNFLSYEVILGRIYITFRNVKFLKCIVAEVASSSPYEAVKFLRGKVLPALKTDNITAICEPIASTMWNVRHFTTL